MIRAYISLGCNLGNCRAYLGQALDMLERHPFITIAAVSSVYLTEPVSEVEQPDFLNMAVAVDTELKARELLNVCHRVEEELGGREGRTYQGPRTIDLDILLYDKNRVAEADLEIPHPRMLDRAFALAPLAEIAPGALIPGNGTAAEALAKLDDPHSVERQGPLLA